MMKHIALRAITNKSAKTKINSFVHFLEIPRGACFCLYLLALINISHLFLC